VADIGKSLKVREFRLFELERIAAAALAKGPQCVRARRVNIERLVQETFGLKIVAFHELSRRWKTYAFIDTTGKVVFVDADLIDNVQMEKKYRFTLGEEFAHLLIHPGIFANCKTIEQRLATEEELSEVRRDRLENNARALASAILMPEATVRPFVESVLAKFTDEHGHVLVDELASAISHEYDVNFKPARRRLKLLGYHRSHGWELD
jgi:Zn-dependent peptidase ImmA (M78 family)